MSCLFANINKLHVSVGAGTYRTLTIAYWVSFYTLPHNYTRPGQQDMIKFFNYTIVQKHFKILDKKMALKISQDLDSVSINKHATLLKTRRQHADGEDGRSSQVVMFDKLWPEQRHLLPGRLRNWL